MTVRLEDILPASSMKKFKKLVQRTKYSITYEDLKAFFHSYEKELRAKNVDPDDLASALMYHLSKEPLV